jgi:hypothetical protein
VGEGGQQELVRSLDELVQMVEEQLSSGRKRQERRRRRSRHPIPHPEACRSQTETVTLVQAEMQQRLHPRSMHPTAGC